MVAKCCQAATSSIIQNRIAQSQSADQFAPLWSARVCSFDRTQTNARSPPIRQCPRARRAVACRIKVASGTKVFPLLRGIGERPRFELIVAADHRCPRAVRISRGNHVTRDLPILLVEVGDAITGHVAPLDEPEVVVHLLGHGPDAIVLDVPGAVLALAVEVRVPGLPATRPDGPRGPLRTDLPKSKLLSVGLSRTALADLMPGDPIFPAGGLVQCTSHSARLRRQHAVLRRRPLAADLRAVRAAAVHPSAARPVPGLRLPDGRVGCVQRVRE